jgi:hypothetical protein
MSNTTNNHQPNADALDPVEQALASFSPASPQIDRDRLMFLAGQASVMDQESGVRSQRVGCRDVDAGGDALLSAGQDGAPSTQYSVLSTEYSSPTLHQGSAFFADRRRYWFWPASTAVLAATSLALAAAIVMRPAPQPLVVIRDRPAPAVVVAPPAISHIEPVASDAETTIERNTAHLPADNYIRTREVALRMGLDALGAPATFSNRLAPPTYRELMQGAAAAGREATTSAARPDVLSSM